MKILITILLSTLVVGCATVPPPHTDHVQCEQLGNYARSVEVLKQVGVSRADVSAYTTEPAVLMFPLQRVKSLVYLKQFNTPADTYVYFYDMCTQVGHKNMLAALTTVEQQELKALTPTPRSKK